MISRNKVMVNMPKPVNEFWAEVCTKAVHGKADKYTKAAKDIIKKYKL